MALEADTEQVERLPLEPVGRLPDAVDGRHHRVVLSHRHPEAEAMSVLEGREVVDDLEALLPAGVINATNVGQKVEAQFRVGLQMTRELRQESPIYTEALETQGLAIVLSSRLLAKLVGPVARVRDGLVDRGQRLLAVFHALPVHAPEAFLAATVRWYLVSPFAIISCSFMTPCSSASGVGGQPGT